MLESVVIMTLVVCGTVFCAYIARLLFLSKCRKSSCCKIFKVERDVAIEATNVSNMKLPIGM